MKKYFISISLCIALTVTMFSCQKEDEHAANIDNQKYSTISIEDAKIMATSLFSSTNESSNNDMQKSSKYQKSVKNQKTFIDNDKKEAFHVINYDQGGFIILSADKRVTPILAYSNTGSFPLDEGAYPLGLTDWVANTKAHIKKVRTNNRPVTEADLRLIEPCAMRTAVSQIDARIMPEEDCDTGGCEDQYITVGPLLQTKWGQGWPYNSMLDTKLCDGNYIQPPAGCVAIAMGQVMRYFKYPAQYSWDAMPVGSNNMYTYSAATANLIKDIGRLVGMDYGCSSSGASQGEIASSLLNDFGYHYARSGDYNYQTVKSEVMAGRPVILTGYDDKTTNWIFWTSYSNGHAWVCDGASSSYYCEIGVSTLYFHMNWGWYDSGYGWYAFNGSWNAEGTGMTFPYKRVMVYNIRP